MKMGNMSKRQQPGQRADNSRRPPMGVQRSMNIPHAEGVISWPLNKIMCYFSENGRHNKLQNI